MSRGVSRQILYIIQVIVVIAGCAKVNAPSGGPRDKIPPVVVKSEPENGIRNFKGKRITITFDEFVVLEKINEKFMVSPPMAKRPDITIKGKSINIEFEEELRDSTTYTFYFQDAIRDLNESNILDNYQFVFSTGSVIDSLSVTGNVYSALTLNPPENTLVMLYSDLDYLSVTEKLPEYISRADANGYFRIDNVRGGRYLLYALRDADNSKNFNLPDEGIAFLDVPVDITAEKNFSPVKIDTAKLNQPKTSAPDTTVKRGEYKLILFEPEKKQRYLTSSPRNMPYQLIYTLSLPPDSLDFNFSIPGADDKSYFIEKNREADTITVWITDSSLYAQQQITTLVRYPFTDTTGLVFQKEDTILMRFLVPRSTRARAKPVPFKIITNLTGAIFKPGQNMVFRSETPLRAPDTSRIRLYEVENQNRKKIPYKVVKDTVNSCRISMTATFAQGKSYLFIADSASFGSIYGEASDSTGYRFSIGKTENFGKLILNVNNYTGSRIIQILDINEKVLRELQMQKDGKIEFPLLDRGKYRLRVIYDINNNGKWTTGDYTTRRQPEPVSFYPMEIEMRENLDVTQIWNIGVMNAKKLKGPATTNRR